MARTKHLHPPTHQPAVAVAGGGDGGTSVAPAPSLWILDSWRDLILFVGTPILIVPLFQAARQQWSAQEIYLFVAAFGALGHHFPGMLRAYGDRKLFQRFRARFIVVPVLLAAICTSFAVRDMGGMIFVAAVWGIWHGLAQTYGFLRIYDAKKGSFAPLTARLDRAMCVAWFGAGILLSPGRMTDLLDRLYRQIGAPILADSFVPGLRTVWIWLTVAITVAFLLHTFQRARAGQPPSPIKLLLMATSFGFWWFACVTVDNMLVGVALFEVFHDVQYLSIVWIFNRNRAKTSGNLTGFMSFLFRRSGALIGLYVGLVFAYGSISYVSSGVQSETLKKVLTGLIVASALLHFYYDGFIWRVREKSTRQSLGLAAGDGGKDRSPGLSPATKHALAWLPLLALIAWLGFTEARVHALGRSDLEIARALVAAVPSSARGHYLLGKALADEGSFEEAIAELDTSLELAPPLADTHYQLARAWTAQNNSDKELFHLQAALAIDPEYAEAHNDISLVWAARGDYEKELSHLREALRINPDYAEAHNNMGVALAASGQVDLAVASFRTATLLDDHNADAFANLGLALAELGQAEEASRALRRALEIEPGLRQAEQTLSRIELRSLAAGN